MAEILLQGSGINKSFGAHGARKQVLFDVDVTVCAGECLAVIGGSGSGKTTLTRILLGLETADSGVVEYRGRNIAKPHKGLQMLREESGLVFQDPFSSLDPRWRVGRSVAEPLKLRRNKLSPAVVEQRVTEALGLVGLDAAAFRNRYPIDLSGGQAQRVAIARAIAAKPKVVLADEALSAIDVAVRVQILDAFAAIRRAEPDMALIMVSHDLGVVRHIADRILVLHEGRVEESGPTARLLAQPQSTYARRLIEAASL